MEHTSRETPRAGEAGGAQADRGGLAGLVALAAYPIADDAGRAAASARLRPRFEEQGYLALPGFLTARGVEALRGEVERHLPRAHARDLRLLAYTDERADESGRGADAVTGAGAGTDDERDPRRRRHRFCMRTIGYDHFDADALLPRLFRSDALTRFIAGVVGDPLYRCEDPLLSCVVTVITAGGEHGWHFDDNELVASLLIEAADEGGCYEMVPHACDDDALVARVMDGARAPVVAPPMPPGTLMLSPGKRSLHRVSPVRAGRRAIALLSYDRAPGMQFPDPVRVGVLGRSA